MRIVSCIQNSFQEYEDHISLVLFCFGCNLRCVGCYNYDTIINPDNIIGTAKEYIDEKLTPLDNAIVFLGGEPTVWSDDLLGAAAYAKSLHKLVKIYTNGTNPKVIKELNKLGLVDAYSVDLKTVTDAPGLLNATKPMSTDEYLMLVAETIKSIQHKGADLEIRTTVWRELKDLEKIKAYVSDRYLGVKHILQKDFRDNIKAMDATV